MTSRADDAAVASPCTSVCVLDPVTGYCAGCFRTLDEIAGWVDFSSTDRREVIAELAGRRSQFGAPMAARLDIDVER